MNNRKATVCAENQLVGGEEGHLRPTPPDPGNLYKKSKNNLKSNNRKYRWQFLQYKSKVFLYYFLAYLMFHKIVDQTVYVCGPAQGDCLYGAISTRVKEDRAGWRRWSWRRRKCFAWRRTRKLKPEITFEARIINIPAGTCKTDVFSH